MGIYLDYNASALIDLRVLDYMYDVYKNVHGNADSRTHDYGDKARKIVEHARKQIADMIGINKDEIFFTSGATESNNIAILGLREYAEKTGKKHIITTSIEHKAVLESTEFLKMEGYSVDFVNPHSDGRVYVEDIMSLITDDTLLVSVMHVNNETGIIQPVKEIGDDLSKKDVLFHIDATQSAGKLVEEIREMSYDMMSFSAHKMYGPQGIGALVMRRKHYKLPPVKSIMYGGPQEHGIRPGTLPVALIAGFGKACEIAMEEYRDNDTKCKEIKTKVIELLDQSCLEYKVNGNIDYGISNTININLKGISSEALMLSTKQYCGISNGSACNSYEYTPSYVLQAMDIADDEINNAIRISWGRDTDEDELTNNFSEMLSIARSLVW